MFPDIFKKYLNFKNITFILVLILFLVFIFNCKNIAVLFFASFVIACSINPIVDKLEEKMPRGFATGLVFVVITAIVLAVFIPVSVLSLEQIKTFLYKLPHYIDNFDEYLFKLPFFDKFSFLATDADNYMEKVSLSSSDMLTRMIDMGRIIGTSAIYILVSIIITFNMVLDKKQIKDFYLSLFPSNMKKKAENIAKIISEKMGGYLTALVATTSSVGIVMGIGLWIAGVPYAMLLAMITAVFDIIPVVGPAFALIICIIATYQAGTSAVVAVIVTFAIAQLIENNFVRPFVFGKIMHIHPLVIFLFLFIAAEYIGVVGVIFAPALASLVAVLLEELYIKKIN